MPETNDMMPNPPLTPEPDQTPAPTPTSPPSTQEAQLALLRKLASIEGELPPPGEERRKAVGRFYARAAADFETYRMLMEGFIPGDRPGAAEGTQISGTFITEYLAELGARSPIERMLAVQMLWQHARVSMLMRMFTCASNRGELRRLSGMSRVIEDALNTSRKQAAAWGQLHAHHPESAHAHARENAHGGPNVLMMGGCVVSLPMPTNELVGTHPKVLAGVHGAEHEVQSSHAERTGVAPRLGISQQAVDSEHRTQDPGR